MLYDWAMEADPREGLENDGRGKLPKRWGAWEFWARGSFPAIKKAYTDKGNERRNVKSLEELGFVFDAEAVNIDIRDRD
jgi:hypothetical protein